MEKTKQRKSQVKQRQTLKAMLNANIGVITAYLGACTDVLKQSAR